MTAAPAATDVNAPDNPSEGHVPFQSEDFKALQKHMEDTLGTPEPQQAPVEDTRPVDPPKVKKETPPAKDKASSKQVAVPESKQAAPEAKEEPETFTSPSRENFKKIVAERDDWKKKATEHETAVKTHAEKVSALEKEYTEFKSKVSFKPEDIESLKKERDSYATQLERHALAETPKFKDHYNGRFEAATSRALDAVGKDKADQIKAVLEAPKSAWRKGMLNELLEGMESQVDKLNLVAAINEYDQARDERGKHLENHKENLRAWKDAQQKEAQEKQEREVSNRKAVLAETLKAAAKFESFTESDDPEHNIAVARNKKLVEDFIVGGNLPDEVVIMLPVLAKQGEHLQKKVPALEAKISELEEALKRYQGAAPELGGSGEPVHESDNPPSFTEQVLKQWPGSLGGQR